MRFVHLMTSVIMAILLLSAKGQAMELSGTLVISTGQQIETLDLKTLERRVVLKDQWPSKLAKIEDNRVLMASDSGIHELDLKTITVKKIREGYSPQYVSEHRKLFFRDLSISGKDEIVLFIADIDEPANAEEIKIPPQKKYGFSQDQVIQVSRDEGVFRYDEEIWAYNIPLRTVRKLPIGTCPILAVFRSASNQIICGHYHKGGKGRKFLVNLNGENVEELPSLATSVPLVYLPKFDVLITVKKRLKLFPIFKLGETADLWVYSFKDGSETLLKKDVWAVEGSTVWIE